MRWIFWKLEEHCIIRARSPGLSTHRLRFGHNLCLHKVFSPQRSQTWPAFDCEPFLVSHGFPSHFFAIVRGVVIYIHMWIRLLHFVSLTVGAYAWPFCLIQELKQIKAWNFGRRPFVTKLSQNIYSLLNLEEKRVNSRGLGSSVRLCPCTGNLSACLSKTFRASSYSTFSSTLFTRQTCIETFIGIISCLEFDVFRGIEWWFLVLPLTNCSVQNNVR